MILAHAHDTPTCIHRFMLQCQIFFFSLTHLRTLAFTSFPTGCNDLKSLTNPSVRYVIFTRPSTFLPKLKNVTHNNNKIELAKKSHHQRLVHVTDNVLYSFLGSCHEHFAQEKKLIKHTGHARTHARTHASMPQHLLHIGALVGHSFDVPPYHLPRMEVAHTRDFRIGGQL